MLAQSQVLVTGATGFIGTHLAQRLLAQGCAVRLLVRDAQRLAPELRLRCEIHVADLASAQGLEAAVSDIDVLFHCAANVRTWDTQQAYQRDNVTAVANLVAALTRARPRLSRLVHFSTCDVYGFPIEPCTELDPAAGGEFGYGRSKLEGELLLAERCAQESIPFTVLRPGNVLGPGGQFVARLGRALSSGVMLTVDGGRANAGLIYIDNLLDYALWAAEAGVAAGRCYNVRDAYDVSWQEFIGRYRAALGGHGLVIDLRFAVANALATISEGVHRALLQAREPLLHRLLVRLFGRTCGHSAARIQRESGLIGAIGFDEALDRSARSFLASRDA